MTDWPGAQVQPASLPPAGGSEPNEWPGLPAPHGVPRLTIYPNLPLSTEHGPQPVDAPAPNQNRIKAIVGAFGQGWEQGFNPQEKLGLSDASTDWLRKVGIFAGADDKVFRPLKTFNEQLIGSAAIALDAGIRSFGGIYRGLQETAIEMGLPKDIASLPDAFAGSPESGIRPAATAKPRPIEWPQPTVLKPPVSSVRPTPIAPIKGSDFADVPRSVAAKTGIPEVDSILNSPVTKAVIDNPVIDRSRDVPYMAGGSKDLNDATVYIDRHVPKTQTVKGVTFDPADPWVVHENSEQHAMQIAIKGGMTPEEAYRVAHFEVAEKAEQAWYRAHGIDQVAAEKEQLSWLPRIQHENPANPPPNLYEKPYPHGNVKGAEHESVEEKPPTPEEKARFFDIIRNAKELKPQSALPIVQEARELGVIGPDRPSLNTLSPEDARREASTRTRNPEAAPGPGAPGGPKEQPSEWRQRFRETLDKMETPADARALLENAIDKSGDEFAAVRQGQMTPAQTAMLSEAFGIDPSDINPVATGKLIKTNAQMANAIEAIRTLDERTRFVSEQIAGKQGANDAEEIAELVRLTAQRDMIADAALVPFIALRAEFGRAGNVIQQFMTLQKESPTGVNDFLKTQGSRLKSTDDVRELAKLIAKTPAEDVPTVLTKMREPTMGPIYYTWVQGLISGIITHSKYVAANEVYALYERGAVTPLAAILNKGRYLGVPGRADKIAKFDDQIFMGEAVAGVVAQFTSVPLSFIGAAQTVKAGVRVPLEDEMALYKAAKYRGEKVPNPIAKTIDAFEQPQERPIPGVAGRVIGAPGDVASGIHAFYKLRGREAAMQALAYRETIKEGVHPFQPGFFERMQWHVANPSEEMRNMAIAEAYKSTFMSELGAAGKAWAAMVKKVPGMRWVFPFAHIPLNLTSAIIENTPAQVLQEEMRADLLGKNGGVAESKAMSRIMLGSSVMGWFTWKALQGQATGDYPTDAETRQDWIATGRQPNSILVNNTWVSFDKFGPAGSLGSLGANVAQVVQRAEKPDDDAIANATFQAAVAAFRLMSDQVGFQSLANMYEATIDDKKGAAWIASEASSFLPFSSMISQSASEADPYMREVKTLMDGLKYRLPELRDKLLPKRDVLGDPIPNPQYGNIIRQRPFINDPVIQELHSVEIHLAPPQDRVKDVKLPPSLYDEYQVKAGALTKAMISSLIAQPGWSKMPYFARKEILQKTITAARQAAEAQMMLQHRDIITQGLQQTVNKINGQPPPAPMRDPAAP